MAMRPRPAAADETHRRSIWDQVLAFDARTLVMWFRAYTLAHRFVSSFRRAPSLANAAQFSPEGDA